MVIKGSRTTEPVIQVALALVMAGVVALAVGAPLAPFLINVEWKGVALFCLFIGAVWMFAALQVDSHQFSTGFLSCLAGTAVSFSICFRIPGSSNTTWASLVPFMASCAGGAIAWYRFSPRRLRRRILMISAAIPFLGSIYVLYISPSLPGYALTRVEGNKAWVNVFADTSAAPRTYVRDPANFAASVVLREDVRIEMDAGSGNGHYRLERVSQPDEVNAACSAMRQYARRLADGEIANNVVPRLITLIPMRYRCRDGKIWRLTPMPA